MIDKTTKILARIMQSSVLGKRAGWLVEIAIFFD